MVLSAGIRHGSAFTQSFKVSFFGNLSTFDIVLNVPDRDILSAVLNKYYRSFNALLREYMMIAGLFRFNPTVFKT